MDFKVRCIASCEPNHYTVGKIYQIKDGIFTTNAGLRLSRFGHTTTLEDAVEAFNDWCPGTTKFELVPDRPHICEVLGVEVDERFKISTGFIYWISEDGYIHGDKTAVNAPTLCSIINHPEKIIRTPQFSEDEKALMRLYVGAGYPIFKPNAFDPCITAWEKSEIHGRALPDGLLLQITDKFNAAEYLEGLK